MVITSRSFTESSAAGGERRFIRLSVSVQEIVIIIVIIMNIYYLLVDALSYIDALWNFYPLNNEKAGERESGEDEF